MRYIILESQFLKIYTIVQQILFDYEQGAKTKNKKADPDRTNQIEEISHALRCTCMSDGLYSELEKARALIGMSLKIMLQIYNSYYMQRTFKQLFSSSTATPEKNSDLYRLFTEKLIPLLHVDPNGSNKNSEDEASLIKFYDRYIQAFTKEAKATAKLAKKYGETLSHEAVARLNSPDIQIDQEYSQPIDIQPSPFLSQSKLKSTADNEARFKIKSSYSCITFSTAVPTLKELSYTTIVACKSRANNITIYWRDFKSEDNPEISTAPEVQSFTFTKSDHPKIIAELIKYNAGETITDISIIKKVIALANCPNQYTRFTHGLARCSLLKSIAKPPKLHHLVNGYDFELVEPDDEFIPRPFRLYFSFSADKLQYKILVSRPRNENDQEDSPDFIIIRDEIPLTALNLNGGQIEWQRNNRMGLANMFIDKELKRELKTLFPQILKLTSERGHTHQNIERQRDLGKVMGT